MTVWLLNVAGGLIAASLGIPAQAGEVRSVEVTQSGDQYNLDVVMQVASEPAVVWAIVTDYAQLDRISPIIIESQLLESRHDNSQRRKLITDSCVWFFCVKATMVEDIIESGEGTIMATIVPEYSDYSYGQSEWQVRPQPGGGTRMHYRGTLDPDYWIPPLIGPWLIERKLRSEAEQMIRSIERLSHAD